MSYETYDVKELLREKTEPRNPGLLCRLILIPPLIFFSADSVGTRHLALLGFLISAFILSFVSLLSAIFSFFPKHLWVK